LGRLEILLSYGPAAKESQLMGVMWYKDTPEHQGKRTTDNKGFTSRKALTAQSKAVQMTGKLHLDFHVSTGNVSTMTSTRRMGDLQLVFSKALT
jgi:hypothetical protein